MTQEDVLLLIAEGGTGSYPLDPIRLMKGAFLVSQLGTTSLQALFSFGPYRYGPFDSNVYAARDRLVAKGLLRASSVGRYSEYELTEAGASEAAVLEDREGEERADWLRQIGRYVTTRSFSQLLEEIYAKYPQYAVRSVMR